MKGWAGGLCHRGAESNITLSPRARRQEHRHTQSLVETPCSLCLHKSSAPLVCNLQQNPFCGRGCGPRQTHLGTVSSRGCQGPRARFSQRAEAATASATNFSVFSFDHITGMRKGTPTE